MESKFAVPKELLRPLDYLPDLGLFVPGPCNPNDRVMKAAGLPLQHDLSAPFLRVVDEVQLGLRYVFQTTNDYTLAVCGAGHGGMEAAIVNVLERGETVLICVNGKWAERAREIAERQGCDVRVIEKPPGNVFLLEELEQGIKQHKPVAMVVVHSESSGGVCQPMDGIGPLCHRHNCLLLVDTVASIGGIPFFTDEWEVDVVYSGVQKALGCPPGLAPITFSPRALAKVEGRKTKVQSYYFDLKEMGKYWGCGGVTERYYHYTVSLSLLYALREGLAVIAEQGLEKYWKKHQECAERLCDGLEAMGLKLLVSDKAIRLRTVTPVLIPEGFPDWKAVINFMESKFKLSIDGGTGPTLGKVWRMGVMGDNCTTDKVDHLLQCFKEALHEVGNRSC